MSNVNVLQQNLHINNRNPSSVAYSPWEHHIKNEQSQNEFVKPKINRQNVVSQLLNSSGHLDIEQLKPIYMGHQQPNHKHDEFVKNIFKMQKDTIPL